MALRLECTAWSGKWTLELITVLCGRMKSHLGASLWECVEVIRKSFTEEGIFAVQKKEQHVRQREQQMPRYEVVRGTGDIRGMC